MIPDRITLLIACAIAAVPIMSLSPMVQQALGVAYTLHALRAHHHARRGYRRSDQDRSVSTGHVARRTT